MSVAASIAKKQADNPQWFYKVERLPAALLRYTRLFSR
jgi:hypothetical protein